MQQTMNTQTKKTTLPRKGYVLSFPAEGPSHEHPLPSEAAKASILPDVRFAIALLQLGELEGERINQAAERDECPATWSDDPQLKLIGDIAVEQPRPLCDALFLLLDGWYRHCQSAQALKSSEEQP